MPTSEDPPKALEQSIGDLTVLTYNEAFKSRGIKVPTVRTSDNVHHSFLVAITRCYDKQQSEINALKAENRRIKTLLKKIKAKVDL